MNKLGIPNKGTHFCWDCFQFESHTVKVDESGDNVKVTLTCECGQEVTFSDPKDTFFEYGNDETKAASV